MKHLRIVIVGGGIGGIATALGLAREGFNPIVLEQATALGEVGAGLTITPNAVKGLAWLGLMDALEAEAYEPPQQLVRNAITNNVLVRIDRSTCRAQYGAPYLQIHRADIHRILVEHLRAAAPESIVLGAQVADVVERSHDIQVILTDGKRIDADILVGADGLRSRIRQWRTGADAVRFTGHVAYRGLVPHERVLGLAMDPGSCVWAGPQRVFLRYPLRQGDLINCVMLGRAEHWAEESWSARADVNELKTLLTGWAPEVQTLIDAIPTDKCFKWGLFDRAPLGSIVTQRVALLGDAAHPMLPFFAQGAAQAIEDAVVLVRCLSHDDTPAEALQRYQRARLERVTMMQKMSAAGGERLQMTETERLGKEPLQNEDTLGIFYYDPATTPI